MSRVVESMLRFFPVPRFLDRVYPALDLSQSSLKLVSAHRTGSDLFPTVFIEEQMPHGAIEDGEIRDVQVVVAALQQLVKKVPSDHDVSRVIVSLPEEFAYIFPVQLQGQTRKEHEIEIELAMSEHVPIPVQFVVHTYEYIQKNVVSVIAYDSRVSASYEQSLTLAGIVPVACMPHIVASSRAVAPHTDTSVFVFDCGRMRSSLALVHNGCVVGSATLHVGTRVLLEKILGTGILAEDAVRLLLEKGVTEDEQVRAAWDSMIASAQPYFTLWKDGVVSERVSVPAPREVYICGGAALIPGVPERLSEVVGFPVSTANVWKHLFSVDTEVPRLHAREAHRFACCAGLLQVNM